ncbi:unnamed protein product [Alternaria alternata]
MESARNPRHHFTLAMALLNYMHAPTVGFYYMGACAFSLCILQKARLVSQKRRRSILISMLTILVAYITEVLYYFRLIASLILLLDAFVILVTKQAEISTDEERQSSLGKQANGSATANGNAGYGTIPTESASDDEEATPKDEDKDIKAQQAEAFSRTKVVGSGTSKALLFSCPTCSLKTTGKVMACLGLRLVHMLQERVLNLLTPRQLGIITDKLQHSYETQSGIMPWKDIGLWVLFSYINSYAGLGIVDGIANLVISNSAYRRITLLAYEHVLGLSMDFHTSKDSGEVLKAVEQASSLNSLIGEWF